MYGCQKLFLTLYNEIPNGPFGDALETYEGIPLYSWRSLIIEAELLGCTTFKVYVHPPQTKGIVNY